MADVHSEQCFSLIKFMCKADLGGDAKLISTCVDLLQSFPWMGGKFA